MMARRGKCPKNHFFCIFGLLSYRYNLHQVRLEFRQLLYILVHPNSYSPTISHQKQNWKLKVCGANKAAMSCKCATTCSNLSGDIDVDGAKESNKFSIHLPTFIVIQRTQTAYHQIKVAMKICSQQIFTLILYLSPPIFVSWDQYSSNDYND